MPVQLGWGYIGAAWGVGNFSPVLFDRICRAAGGVGAFSPSSLMGGAEAAGGVLLPPPGRGRREKTRQGRILISSLG